MYFSLHHHHHHHHHSPPHWAVREWRSCVWEFPWWDEPACESPAEWSPQVQTVQPCQCWWGVLLQKANQHQQGSGPSKCMCVCVCVCVCVIREQITNSLWTFNIIILVNVSVTSLLFNLYFFFFMLCFCLVTPFIPCLEAYLSISIVPAEQRLVSERSILFKPFYVTFLPCNLFHSLPWSLSIYLLLSPAEQSRHRLVVSECKSHVRVGSESLHYCFVVSVWSFCDCLQEAASTLRKSPNLT